MWEKLVVSIGVLIAAILVTLGTSKVSDVIVPPQNDYVYNSILSALSYTPPAPRALFLCNGSNWYLERRSGWPLHYALNNLTLDGADASACGAQVYPIIFLCDFLFFFTIFLMILTWVKSALTKRHGVTDGFSFLRWLRRL